MAVGKWENIEWLNGQGRGKINNGMGKQVHGKINKATENKQVGNLKRHGKINKAVGK